MITALTLSVLIAASPLPQTPARGFVASASCATSDTTLPHDELLEGWQNAGPENTWAAGGSADVGTPNTNFDSSALTTGKPTGACNAALQWAIVAGNTGSEYQQWDRGSAINVTTTMADFYIYIYVTTAPDDGENFSFMSLGSTADTSSGTAVDVNLRNNGGTLEVRASSTTDSSFVALTANSWNKIQIHSDTTAASCSITVNDGTPATYTRTGQGIRFVSLGATAGKTTDDSATFVLDVAALNTP